MGRLRVVIVVATLGFVSVAAACGSDTSVADSKIISALKLERSPEGPAYSIGGDPFCLVSADLLNDSGEVETASDSKQLDLVITDSEETVGVQAVPPFDPECARHAKRELEKLE